ncbi:hypothetical protein AAKU55_001181 [Oxalobacteraceae bacterium GrIS 1.11]
MNKTLNLLAFAATVILAPAHATTIQNSATGLSGNFITQTFEQPAAPDYIKAANLFAGVSFDANVYTDSDFPGLFGNITDHFVRNRVPGATVFAAETSFTFAAPVRGAAFAFMTNPGGVSSFSAYLGNTLVESFSADAKAEISGGGIHANYFGFSGISFDKIVVSAGGQSNTYWMDNLQIAAVPEPETYAMLLAGLGLLGFMARRKSAHRA